MNWHFATNWLGRIFAAALICFAIASFMHLNTPELGILTWDGFLKIACPFVAGASLFLFLWCHRVFVPAASGVSTPEKLKAQTLTRLRQVNARLSRAGKYQEVAKLAAVEKELEGMFQP